MYQDRTGEDPIKVTWEALVMPALLGEQKHVERQIAAADGVLAAAEKKHEETTAPLCARLYEIKIAISDAGDARRLLEETCADPAIVAELRDLTASLRAVASKRTRLADDARQLRESASALRAHIPQAFSEAKMDELRAGADRDDARAAQVEAGLTVLAKEEADLQRREAAIRERMLEA